MKTALLCTMVAATAACTAETRAAFVRFHAETTSLASGRVRFRLYAEFNHPNDTVLGALQIHAISTWGGMTGISAGNFWHQDFLNGNVATNLLGTWNPTLLVSVLQSEDSWVTIGGQPADFGNTTTADPGWGPSAFNQPGIPDTTDAGVAGWFNTNPPNLQGRAIAVSEGVYRTLLGNFVVSSFPGITMSLGITYNQGSGTPMQFGSGLMTFPLSSPDVDGDSVADWYDNCPNAFNPTQSDCDGDGIGDACETDPDLNLNGVPDNCETGPLVFAVPQSFATVGAAIDAAPHGAMVRVGPGTYAERLDFAGKAITVESIAGSASTILDGGGTAGSVVSFVSGEGTGTVLRGFTIRNGAGGSPTASDPEGPAVGGGVRIEHASPLVEECVIEDCSAPRGGGIAIVGSAATIRRCVLRGNAAEEGGGGLFLLRTAEARIDECLIEGNSAPEGGGMLAFLGAASVVDSDFLANATVGEGSAIRWRTLPPDRVGTPRLNLERCELRGNTSATGGAAIAADPGLPSLSLAGVLFCDNSSRNLDGPFLNLGGNLVCDCPADVTLDGVVGAGDLAFVIGSWGPCTGPCPADIDGDGDVDANDLSFVIGEWGACR